jgi:spore germination protein GerM
MDSLLSGPTAAEQDEGIGSALTGGEVIGDVTLADGQAKVDLVVGLDGTGRSDAVLAIAQVVCTLDAQPDVAGVVFTREGEVVAVPRADGALSKGPLTATDYQCPALR